MEYTSWVTRDDELHMHFELDYYMPQWLYRLIWPDHSFDPEDQEVHLSVYEKALRDMRELAVVEMLTYSFTDPLPRSNGATYTRQRYDNFPNLALPTGQE